MLQMNILVTYPMWHRVKRNTWTYPLWHVLQSTMPNAHSLCSFCMSAVLNEQVTERICTGSVLYSNHNIYSGHNSWS